jgi:hypothetical protein
MSDQSSTTTFSVDRGRPRVPAEKLATGRSQQKAAKPMERPKIADGWTLPFVSSHGPAFAGDGGAGGGFLLSVFLRDGANVYRTYTTTGRGIDRLTFVTSVLDLTVYGRQEDWENSPPGWPQQPTSYIPNTMPLRGEAVSFG